MNLDDLRAVQANEREASGLQPLEDSFYRDVASYLESLRAERDRLAEQAEDPFSSDEIRSLTDEIETATEVTEAIYDRRVGKVVKRASLAAAGMSVERGGLTTEEAALFEDLVDQIEANRSTVLDVIGGDTAADLPEPGSPEPQASAAPDAAADPTGTPEEPPGPDEAANDAPSTADELAQNDEEPAADEDSGSPPEDPSDDTDRVTLRITEDIGEIYGVDERVYELGKEDVVTLPEANAGPLLEQGAAVRIDD